MNICLRNIDSVRRCEGRFLVWPYFDTLEAVHCTSLRDGALWDLWHTLLAQKEQIQPWGQRITRNALHIGSYMLTGIAGMTGWQDLL